MTLRVFWTKSNKSVTGLGLLAKQNEQKSVTLILNCCLAGFDDIKIVTQIPKCCLAGFDNIKAK